jgi:hypothetical protein
VSRCGGKSYLKDKEVERRVILKFIFIKQNEEAWSGLKWLGIETNGGLL